MRGSLCLQGSGDPAAINILTSYPLHSPGKGERDVSHKTSSVEEGCLYMHMKTFLKTHVNNLKCVKYMCRCITCSYMLNLRDIRSK